MRIGVLGPLEIDEESARLGVRDRIVLAALAMTPGDLCSPEQLADAVWGDDPPASWAKNLQGCISRLRKLLGADAIETSAHGYRLRVAADSVDAVEFTRAAHRARELLTLGECERARYVATEALELWRGRPLVELEAWEPGVTEMHRLEEVRAELEELAVEASLAAGHHADVLAKAAAMVEAAPLRERRWALLAQAQYLAGRQSEALRTLRRVRVVLARDLGLDPGPDLVALEQSILRQDPELSVDPAPPTRAGGSPYPGLAAYGEEDAESFVGREEETRICLDRLVSVRLLAIVGPSGSGKSSLLRAGLAAALRREGNHTVVLMPGRHPMDTLTAAARRPDSVVLVDQTEEAFALCDDEDERERFFDALVAQTGRGRVVLALRGDHTGDLAGIPGLAVLVEQGLFLLGPMSAECLRAAIENPARQHGLVLEHGLTDLLLREIEGEPGALPLLSHALRETWLRHEGRTLTVAGYQASGGVRGAVAQSAEALYTALDDTERIQLRDLVLRLVVPGPRGEPVRGEVPRHQVVEDPTQDRLIDLMVAARLVTSDADTFELAHEAVVRAWPRLRGWLEDDLEGQRTRHHLTQAAEDWAGSGSQDSDLYRGTRLAATRDWVASSKPRLTDLEQRFLAASEKQAAAEEASAVELARTRGRMVHRLRFALGGAAVLLVLALITGFLALGEAHQSRASRDRAIHAEAVADAQRLGAQALIAPDLSLANLLAAEAIGLNDDPVTRSNAWDILAGQPNLIWASAPLGHAVFGLSVSADGTRVAAYDTSNRISVLDGAGGGIVGHIPASAGTEAYPQGPLAFNPRKPQLAVGAQAAAVPALQLVDAHILRPSGPHLRGLPVRPAEVWDVRYSSNGRYLAASFNENRADGVRASSIRVWDLAHRREPARVVPVSPGPAGMVALSDNGRRVYNSMPLTAYRVSDGRRLYQVPRLWTFFQIGFDSHGRTLAVGPAKFMPPRPFPPKGHLYLIDARDGTQAGTITMNDNRPLAAGAAEYSHDGRLIAVATEEPSVQVRSAGDGRLELTIPINAPNAIAFSPDDHTLFTAGGDGVVRAWDLVGRGAAVSQLALSTRSGIGGDPSVAPNAAELAIDAWQTSRSLVDLRSGRERRLRDDDAGWPLANGEPDGATWRPDGGAYAVGGTDLSTHSAGDGLVEIFDTTGRKVGQVKVPSPVTGLSYSSDGSRVLVAEVSGRIDVLDGSSLHQIGKSISVDGPACCLAAASEGALAAVIVASGKAGPESSPRWNRWAIVDTVAGTTVNAGSFGGDKALDVALSPDGRRMAVGMSDGTMRLIDRATGEQINSPVARNDTPISFVAFDDTGTTIATSDDDALTLWDGLSGEERASLPLGHVGAPIFVDGGARIVLVTRNVVTFTWRFGPDGIQPALCRAAGRNLTSDEWATYLPGRPYEKSCPQYG
jgi:DNA-binding SARP family transcriptional activator/WD40 repeat protein